MKLKTYLSNHSIHPDMLRDVDRWIMEQINAEES